MNDKDTVGGSGDHGYGGSGSEGGGGGGSVCGETALGSDVRCRP